MIGYNVQPEWCKNWDATKAACTHRHGCPPCPSPCADFSPTDEFTRSPTYRAGRWSHLARAFSKKEDHE